MATKNYKDMTEEERKEYRREYYKRNKERILRLTKQSQQRNIKKILKRNKEKRANNIEYHREWSRNYNARFRSPESQKIYEENKKKGHKNIGPRDDKWFKSYNQKKDIKKGKSRNKRYDDYKPSLEKVYIVSYDDGIRLLTEAGYNRFMKKNS